MLGPGGWFRPVRPHEWSIDADEIATPSDRPFPATQEKPPLNIVYSRPQANTSSCPLVHVVWCYMLFSADCLLVTSRRSATDGRDA